MAPMVDGNTNIQHWWNDTNSMEPKYLSHCYFVIKPTGSWEEGGGRGGVLREEKLVINLLNRKN